MSEHPALSSVDEKNVQAEIDRRLEANRIRTAYHTLGCLVAFALAGGLLPACPPASVAFAAAALAFGGGLLGNAATKRVLHAVSREIATEGFIDKLERRANGGPDLTAHVPALLGILGSFAIVGSMFM